VAKKKKEEEVNVTPAEETAEETVQETPEVPKVNEWEEKYNAERDAHLRLAAEYDNFRRRSREEHTACYENALSDTVSELLPIIDNLERAAECSDGAGVAEGVKMTLTQCKASLEKLGVEPISSEIGQAFDPEVHNAVMHVDDPEQGESVIAAVFQKGYKKGDRVLRFAMVSVAN
jgi:molecular chaperone GrpE